MASENKQVAVSGEYYLKTLISVVVNCLFKYNTQQNKYFCESAISVVFWGTHREIHNNY